ncbi:MAG: endonuclease/exonuclease/phosphatase family protein, partial [Planctomycetes bacterium]|nr:endonuclease/exonuclease/phosphatase family protein [Planctomycetota bacterium]
IQDPAVELSRPDELPVYKGVLKCELDLGPLKRIDVYNIHAGAVGFDPSLGTRDPSQDQRNENHLREAIAWIKKTHVSGRPLVIGGDLNRDPEIAWSRKPDPIIAVFKSELGVFDSYRRVRGTRPVGYTAGPANAWARETADPRSPKQALDYIFAAGMEAKDSQIVFTDAVGDPPMLPSDHFGVLTTFELPEKM